MHGFGDGRLGLPDLINAGGSTRRVDTGFVSADKIPDVIAGNESADYASLFLGESDGTLRAQRQEPVGDRNSAVLAAQLDGKPDEDLAVTVDAGDVVTCRSKPGR